MTKFIKFAIKLPLFLILIGIVVLGVVIFSIGCVMIGIATKTTLWLTRKFESNNYHNVKGSVNDLQVSMKEFIDL